MIYANIRSYRSALFAYHMNPLNIFPVPLRALLPMSFFPMYAFIDILESVAIQQSQAEDRVSLVIPITDLLSYCNSRFFADAITVTERLSFILNVPLASHQTVSKSLNQN